MNIGEASNQCDHGIIDPLGGASVEGVEGNEKREGPELENDCGRDRAVDLLAEVRCQEQHGRADDYRGNGQQVGLRGVEAEIAKGKGKVGLRRADGHCTDISCKL